MHVDKIDAISPVMLAWLLRTDLRRGEAAGSPVPEWFRTWWAMEGHREYPGWSDHKPDSRHLFAPLPNWPRCGEFGMTPALRYVMDRREDLAQAFDVTTEQGLWHAIAWFYVHGIREHRLASSLDAVTLDALDSTPPCFEPVAGQVSTHPPLTWLMFFVWRCSEDLHAHFDLRDSTQHATYLEWFLFQGISDIGLAPLVAPRWRAWMRQPMGLHKQARVAVPRAGCLMWQRRQDLQMAFDLRDENGMTALAAWTAQAWEQEPGMRWAAAPAKRHETETPAHPVTRPFGLNLIGFAFGELGIGEDVRMAAAACEAAGIPFAVLNIHPGGQLRQADKALASHVKSPLQGEEAPYAINLFCLTGFDTARVALERGPALFAGRKNIGWWPWELPVWPGEWLGVFDLVDEVWAATEFTEKMYVEAAGRASANPTPVVLMPMPASVARVKPVTRRELSLPEDKFLFLYVFDFNSYLARKNPFAALKAFRTAFDAHDDSVGLVLKTMNSNRSNPVWKRFLLECAKDSRITLLAKTLDRGEVLGLIKSCDAYVSLHRAEGFGRTLAEAMLFGKPVVGTNFSGNVDFLTVETGFPVKWKRKKVASGDYPFITGEDSAWWAEPDIADSARQTQAARAAAMDNRFSAEVKSFAEEKFSPARVGASIRRRIEANFNLTSNAPFVT